MIRVRKKLVYGLLGVLVIFACVPLSIPRPTEAPAATAALSASAPEVNVSQTPTNTVVPTQYVINTPVVEATTAPISSELYAFIQAPNGPLSQPYVILIAFQSTTDISINITGSVNSVEFVCNGSPCAVPVSTSSLVVFRAMSSTGGSTEDISATVRVEQKEDGYYVYLDSVSQFANFSDACLRNWNLQNPEIPTWAEFVQFPYQLNTQKTLHYLVTRLIVHGIVDVAGCPAGGLNTGLDWPTGCGLERAKSAMIEWQNKFDDYIWLASKEEGIPPKILKTLIETESQFWPGNQRFYVDEVGLGQLNQLGVDVLLRKNPDIYQQVCSTVLDDCAMPYTLLSAQNQAMVRGAFITAQDSLCPTCQYGLDLNKAKQSVPFIAQVVYANCQSIKTIVDRYQSTDLQDDIADPYTDFWKFTLLSYHSGISCFENAAKAASKANLPLSWDNLLLYLDCKGGQAYVDGVWNNLLNFDTYRYTPAGQELAQYSPVFMPTRTPVPTPTSAMSAAHARIQVFLDSNQNGTPEEGEWLNGVPVSIQAPNGTELTGTTVDGQAVFDLSVFVIGTNVTVSLPGLYRSESFTVPAQGEVPVTFIFNQPALPTAIP